MEVLERTWEDIINSNNFGEAFVAMQVATGCYEGAAWVSLVCFREKLYWFQQRRT